jgi:hypothetical protein
MDKEQKSVLPQGITEEMVSQAKAKYGDKNVKIMELPLDDNGEAAKPVLVKVPDRNIISQYRKYADSDPKKADEIMVKNCVLSHKEEVLADDGLFYGALNGISSLIPIRTAVIKNL